MQTLEEHWHSLYIWTTQGECVWVDPTTTDSLGGCKISNQYCLWITGPDSKHVTYKQVIFQNYIRMKDIDSIQ